MKRFIVVLVALVALVIVGCGRGERASITGVVLFYYDWYYQDSLIKEGSFQGYKYNGFKIIPVMTINGDTLPIDYFNYSPTEFEYVGSISGIDFGDECKFKVDYGEGKGEATDTMPGQFRITAPDTTYILRKGNNLNITWSSASGANWYWLYLDIGYDYIDTAGYWNEYYFELDTIVDGTSYTLSAGKIFPPDVDSVLNGRGFAYVQAVSGPKLVPGAKGNIKGDAVGFFWCVFDGKPVWFGIEHLAAKPDQNRQSEIRKRHLETMQKFALENE